MSEELTSSTAETDSAPPRTVKQTLPTGDKDQNSVVNASVSSPDNYTSPPQPPGDVPLIPKGDKPPLLPKPALRALRLKISAPPETTSELTSQSSDWQRLISLRRSDRQRNQALKADETRRAREERAAVEEARTKARSIAAKKAAATKKKAAKRAAEIRELEAQGVKIAPQLLSIAPDPGTGKIGKRSLRRVVKLHYFNPAVPPVFAPLDFSSKNTSISLFWLRLNLREFLYRFDKLCRLPTRLTAGLNDPLETWTPEQLKAICISLLKLIANDAKPLHPRVREFIAEIEALEPTNPQIWDWLLEFVEQLDANAPEEVPTTEEEQLELLRRLLVVCTGTETIRITVMSDVDQLRWVEKDTNDETKAIWAKCKESEQRLEKLKASNKQLWAEKVAAAQRSASNKAWKAQQQLFIKTHKYNMRTAPLLVDPYGNKYWSLQFKSASHPAWGSWIVCEMRTRPAELAAFFQRLSSDVTSVLTTRDRMINEKNRERRKQRREERKIKQETLSNTEKFPPGQENEQIDNAELKQEDTREAETNETGNGSPPEPKQAKRKYPKLKINLPATLAEPELFIVEGRENILQLATWVAGFSNVDKKAVAEMEAIATYLAQDS